MPTGDPDEEDVSLNGLYQESSEEARHTVDHQVEKIQNTDHKAVSLLRVNILLVGLLLTVASLSVQSDQLNINQFLNLCTIAGSLMLGGSTYLCAVTYTSSSLDLGIGPGILADVQTGTLSEDELQTELVTRYQQWMKHNKKVNQFNKYLVTTSIIFLLAALIYFAAGVIVGLEELQFTLWEGGIAALATLIWIIGGALVWYAERIYTRLAKLLDGG